MIKTKTLKSLVIALTLLFAMALTLGITGAAYSANRNADGTLSMANGIVIDYSGFGKAQDGIWEKEQTTTFKLFTDRAIVPGDTVTLNSAAIKKGTNSIDFYARIKFEYKFYDALDADITTTVGNEYTNFISTPTFASAWANGNAGDGWFYYATGTTLNTLPASYVNIFSSSAINVELSVPGFNHEGGGYKFTDAGSNEVTIAKVEAILTLETVQTTGSTWEIIPLVQNSSSQVIEIQSNEITLGNVGGAYKLGTGEAGSLAYDTTSLGTTLKIIVAGDSQINANAFANNTNLENIYIGDVDYISGASSYSAKIYTGETPLFKIGANAFRGCSSLNVYLSSSCNYQIYVSSLAGVNHVYLDGVLADGLKNPSVGAYNAYITVSANPSIVGGAVSQVSDSKGEYTYTDVSGNIWYFDLGSLSLSANGQTMWTKDNTNGVQAQIRYCDMSSNESNQTLTIPSLVALTETVGNISVVEIYGYDLSGFPSDKNCVTSVAIPNSVTSVGNNAFRYCAGLTSITIPNSVISIANSSFCDCTSLTSIEIPNSVISIGYQSFYACTSLTSITIPNSVTIIGDCVFGYCTGLELFVSYNSKYTISSDSKCLIENDGENHRLIAFAGFEVTGAYTGIPNSVTEIGSCAFAYYTGLTSITIPSSVTSIGFSAFSGCTGLTSITIPNSVTIIGTGVFSYCTNLTSVSISNSLTAIGDSMFHSCSSLTSITIPSSVTRIDSFAFHGCSSLTSITIPSSVTSISYQAFRYCTALTTVVINGEITEVPGNCFGGCANLQNLTLPVSVTSISDSAFNGCSSLQNISWSASYNLGAEKNNEVVTLVRATTGLTIGDINLPDGADLAAASITAPTGQVFVGWTDGETTYTTTAPIATVRAGLTAVWGNQ